MRWLIQTRYADSRFIQTSALVPNAAPIARAVSGVISFFPLISLETVETGRPMICAKSSCDSPRASSSSLMNSPGGETCRGTGCSLGDMT